MMIEPVSVGDFITIEFDEHHQIEGHVRWVRRLIAGMEFNNPLSLRFVMHLHERAHEESQAEPDDGYLMIPPRTRARRTDSGAPAPRR